MFYSFFSCFMVAVFNFGLSKAIIRIEKLWMVIGCLYIFMELCKSSRLKTELAEPMLDRLLVCCVNQIADDSVGFQKAAKNAAEVQLRGEIKKLLREASTLSQ